MADYKTQPTAKSVPEFLEQIEDPKRRADCKTIAALMEKLSGSKPKMWGDSIVGFGDYRYKYASGREGKGIGSWWVSLHGNRISRYISWATWSIIPIILKSLVNSRMEKAASISNNWRM